MEALRSPKTMKAAQPATNALKIMKPNGAPRRLKSEFQDNKCDYHFIWCPCNNDTMSKEIEKRDAEKEEKENFNFF